MSLSIPSFLTEFAALFPVPLYLVGGYVRDGVRGIVSDDYDIASSLPCEEVEKLAKGKYRISTIKRDTGTVGISVDGHELQYTSFRKDIYTTGHTPAQTQPASIEEDARRRDFKANAVYYNLRENVFFDPLGGLQDIERRVLSATRPPEEVFSEDGLRLLRLARIAAETGFSVEEGTLLGAKHNAFRIREIAPERIRVELEKILHADKPSGIFGAPSRGLRLLEQIGVLEILLPELTLGIGMKQRSDFHRFDVFGHILSVIDYADPSVRTAALFHDIAKPYCQKNFGSYHMHEVYGEQLTEDIMNRLRYSKAEIKITKRLVKWHMLDLRGDMRENKIRKFVQENADILELLCLLKEADMYGCGIVTSGACSAAERLRTTYKRMKAEGVPFSKAELLVKGEDLPPPEILPYNERESALKNLLIACSEVNTPLTTREKQLQYLYRYSKKR